MLKRTNTLLIAAITLLASACGDAEKKDQSAELKKLKQEQKALQEKIAKLESVIPKKDSGRVIPVHVTSMSPSVFTNYIDVQGKVDVDEEVVAIPENPMGIIEAILVKPGQYVRKGQIVARLRSDVADKSMAQLDQQIAFAKTLYDKQKRLWDQEIGTEVQLISAKHQYEALLKQKTTVQAQRSMSNVYSPINGVVDAVDATVGQSYASPMPPVIRIINTGKLKIEAAIAENYAGIVRTGSPVLVVFPDLGDSLATKVNYAERTISAMTKTFAAYIPLPGNPKYHPNMTAQVRIATYMNNKAFVLPVGVIQNTDNGHFVYVAGADGKAKIQQVVLGRTYMGKAEITEGLTLGDQVITTGYEELNEGDRIQIEP